MNDCSKHASKECSRCGEQVPPGGFPAHKSKCSRSKVKGGEGKSKGKKKICSSCKEEVSNFTEHNPLCSGRKTGVVGKCRNCGAGFESLKHHLATHPGCAPKERNCRNCKAKFTDLKQHLRSHPGCDTKK